MGDDNYYPVRAPIHNLAPGRRQPAGQVCALTAALGGAGERARSLFRLAAHPKVALWCRQAPMSRNLHPQEAILSVISDVNCCLLACRATRARQLSLLEKVLIV